MSIVRILFPPGPGVRACVRIIYDTMKILYAILYKVCMPDSVYLSPDCKQKLGYNLLCTLLLDSAGSRLDMTLIAAVVSACGHKTDSRANTWALLLQRLRYGEPQVFVTERAPPIASYHIRYQFFPKY